MLKEVRRESEEWKGRYYRNSERVIKGREEQREMIKEMEDRREETQESKYAREER